MSATPKTDALLYVLDSTYRIVPTEMRDHARAQELEITALREALTRAVDRISGPGGVLDALRDIPR